MFTITIAVSGSTPFVLVFKSEEAQQEALAQYEAAANHHGVWLSDDFGQRALVNKPAALLAADMRQAREAQVAQSVLFAEAQVLAQTRAAESPIIKNQMRVTTNPAILSPFPARPHG